MGGVHYHAFLPPRTLLPLNDPRTFKPADHSLHVIALPVDAESASSAQPSEPAQPAPAHARNQAAEAADASIRIARRRGDNSGAEAAVLSITDEAQDAMHAGNSRAADIGAQEESWQESSGSVPVRRSRRLRSSVHASGEFNVPSLRCCHLAMLQIAEPSLAEIQIPPPALASDPGFSCMVHGAYHPATLRTLFMAEFMSSSAPQLRAAVTDAQVCLRA